MTDVWQSILDEVPEYTGKGIWDKVPKFVPFKVGGVAYIHAPPDQSVSDCSRCVARQVSTPMCKVLPDCDDTCFKLFEPSDFAIMIAEGRTLKGDSDG